MRKFCIIRLLKLVFRVYKGPNGKIPGNDVSCTDLEIWLGYAMRSLVVQGAKSENSQKFVCVNRLSFNEGFRNYLVCQSRGRRRKFLSIRLRKPMPLRLHDLTRFCNHLCSQSRGRWGKCRQICLRKPILLFTLWLNRVLQPSFRSIKGHMRENSTNLIA